jgi:hypothetical protein
VHARAAGLRLHDLFYSKQLIVAPHAKLYHI